MSKTTKLTDTNGIEPLLNDETDLYKRTIYLFLSGLLHYKQGEKQSGIDGAERKELEKGIVIKRIDDYGKSL